jgi:hypothetical protein
MRMFNEQAGLPVNCRQQVNARTDGVQIVSRLWVLKNGVSGNWPKVPKS